MTAQFKCRAQTTNYGDPIDCDWPHCGCDDYATKVVTSLIEGGWGDVAAEREACAKVADEFAEQNLVGYRNVDNESFLAKMLVNECRALADTIRARSKL